MSDRPSALDLQRSLAAAAVAHHEYEQKSLQGVRDEQWAGWYAAYVLGRLGDFTPPSVLTGWIESVQAEGDWSANAGRFIEERLKGA